MLLPLMAALDTDISEEEATVRILAAVEQMKLKSDICPFVIGFYESVGKENRETKNREEKVISKLVRHFKVHDCNLDFTSFGIQSLNQAVGECLFMSKSRAVSHDHLFELLMRHQDSIDYLLRKIRDKAITFADILQEIVEESGRSSRLARKGILQIILLGEVWHNCNDGESTLKKEATTMVMTEALHRILYLLYNDQDELPELFIAMLARSSLPLRPELKGMISYHLLAFHSILEP